MSGMRIRRLWSIYTYLYPYIEARRLFKPELCGNSRTGLLYMLRLPRELDTPKFNSEFNKVFNVVNAGENNVKVTGL